MQNNLGRRELFRNVLLLGAAGASGSLATAEPSASCLGKPTPPQGEGPFFPLLTPRDVDADLTLIQGSSRRARGEVIELIIEVSDLACRPIAGALVDLWQACYTGRYNHPADSNNAAELDPDFQYAAKLLSNGAGRLKVRTIKPGAYPAGNSWVRPPHIHMKITAFGFEELTTQIYFAGEALNQQDFLLNQLSPAERNQLVVRYERQEASGIPLGTFRARLKEAESAL